MSGSYRPVAVTANPHPARRTSPIIVLLLAIAGVFTNGLAYLLIIALFGAVVGGDPSPTASEAADAPVVETTTATTTTTAPVTTTSAAPAALTVVRADGADRIVLTDGTREVLVRVAGIDAPDVSGGQCWSAEAVAWATTTLAGKTVTIGTAALVADAVVSIALPDGSDYAALAMAAGAARAADTVFAAAEAAARTAGSGFWGSPCKGQLSPPAVQPLVPSPRPAPAPTTQPQPAPKPAPVPPPTQAPPPPPVDVYYANCTEVKAAGAAPLYRGEPGYRSGLDRDDDGVACET